MWESRSSPDLIEKPASAMSGLFRLHGAWYHFRDLNRDECRGFAMAIAPSFLHSTRSRFVLDESTVIVLDAVPCLLLLTVTVYSPSATFWKRK